METAVLPPDTSDAESDSLDVGGDDDEDE
jgi:hypothetical protein